MSVIISIKNHDPRDNFVKLDDDQFIELWSYLHLPTTLTGEVYGTKMYNLLQKAMANGAVYNSKINVMITMDVIHFLGILIFKSMQAEEKLVWTNA